MRTVSFTRMDQGTKHDYQLIATQGAAEIAAFPERVLGWLAEMDGPSPYQVTHLEHSLQAATRALRAGEDPNLRDAYHDHDWNADTIRFCAEYDQVSFDPDYPSVPLEYFEPMVRRLLAEPRYSQ